MRVSSCLLIASFIALGAIPRRVLGNHFEVTLAVSDARSTQSATTETDPPSAGAIVKRPVMESAFGTRCTASWKVTSENKEMLKDVLVHFYVVRIDKLGQAPPPLEPTQVVLETALSMDFANHTKSSAQLQFQPDRPGIYLIRIETQGTTEAKRHEHYAAMDLVVK
jgi:hypothetical protein